MPEGLEAEIWRRSLEPTVGRGITAAEVDERVAPSSFVDRVVGSAITGVRRVGKVLLVDTDGPTIGLHFGMTGRVVVDGRSAIERLEYASGGDRPEWDRLRLFTRSVVPAIRMNDPRRLGRVSLDPPIEQFGPDLFAVTAEQLAGTLGRRRIAVKTALLDQTVVAGLGNLCADEVLWWAGIDPHRAANSLDGSDIEALVCAMRSRLPVMLDRGGSTNGELDPDVRAACPPCSRDGGPLRRDTIAGRTAVWCPRHQR